ncbi:MAG: efflux RND transporter periplasmic adaptor subunit, partial [Isosphaeraceae bacterium]
MTPVGTEPARLSTPEPANAKAADRPDRPSRPRGPRWGRLVIVLLVLAAAGYGLYHYRASLPFLMKRAQAYVQEQLEGKRQISVAAAPSPPSAFSNTPWNGAVVLEEGQAQAIGLNLVKVLPQNEPIKLELTGRTAYDPNSLYKVRPRFDTLVEMVHAELGQLVHKGDPLVDLHSVDLAAAKNDLQAKYVQWRRDLRVKNLDEKLLAEEAVSQQKLVDDKNAESKSHLDYLTTRDKLRILGVPDADIDPLI